MKRRDVIRGAAVVLTVSLLLSPLTTARQHEHPAQEGNAIKLTTDLVSPNVSDKEQCHG